jgi:AcrR family transcriptional regulator
MPRAVKRGPPAAPRREYHAPLRREQAQATRLRILEAARTLFIDRGYAAVTVHDIAAAAGVAYPTVYAIFRTKPALARGIIEAAFEVEDVGHLIAEARASRDPEVWLRTVATVSRRLNERFASVIRFMRESGDPDLHGDALKLEARRYRTQSDLGAMLRSSGRLRSDVSPAEAVALIWAMSGPDMYARLVLERRWSSARFEAWLGGALIGLLLQDERGSARRRT